MIFRGMRNTTRGRRKTSTTVSAREVRIRLRDARAQNAKLQENGTLPPATKKWSHDSMLSLKKALSTKQVFIKDS